MDAREKLVELLLKEDDVCKPNECKNCGANGSCYYHRAANRIIANCVTVQEWISVKERLPQNFVSVLGYMTDAGEFPPVRECYTVGNAFFFPALDDIHPVSHWCEMPQPPKGE